MAWCALGLRVHICCRNPFDSGPHHGIAREFLFSLIAFPPYVDAPRCMLFYVLRHVSICVNLRLRLWDLFSLFIISLCLNSQNSGHSRGRSPQLWSSSKFSTIGHQLNMIPSPSLKSAVENDLGMLGIAATRQFSRVRTQLRGTCTAHPDEIALQNCSKISFELY
jgi:hypothetical protein